MVKARILVPLSQAHKDAVLRAVGKAHPHRQNWLTPAPGNTPQGCTVEDINNGRYSSRCSYTHWTYQPTIGSYAVLRDWSDKVEYQYGADAPRYLAPPRGYRWDRDSNGLRIVSLTDPRKDYHPNSSDLVKYDARALARKAADLFVTRQAAAKTAREEMRLDKLSENERTRLIAKAEREGCMVCMADSLKAGNCRAGTENFAARHNLDPKKHYRPSQLLRLANGAIDRVKLAVAVALRRHRHEMTVGYALLADHVV